jgi:hypothetical protein
MNIKVTTITPKMAAEFLKCVSPEKQRNVQGSLVDVYASAMRNDMWVLTHQGIAFNTAGELCDGQHRMQAVVKSGKTIKMVVTTGIEETQNGVHTFDAIDRGVVRKIADQLKVRHGIKNANHVASACRTIGVICLRTNFRASVENTVLIYDRFSKDINAAVSGMISSPASMRLASIEGTLAFCHRVFPAQIEKFIDAFSTGENIKNGDPAFALRSHILKSTKKIYGNLGGHEKQVALCAMHHVLGTQVKQVKDTYSGLDFFADKQTRIVEEVRSILS